MAQCRTLAQNDPYITEDFKTPTRGRTAELDRQTYKQNTDQKRLGLLYTIVLIASFQGEIENKVWKKPMGWFSE